MDYFMTRPPPRISSVIMMIANTTNPISSPMNWARHKCFCLGVELPLSTATAPLILLSVSLPRYIS
jgi:hypothetical protein